MTRRPVLPLLSRLSVRRALLRLPIKWKLTVGSALLMLLLFVAYNAAQYFYIERWVAQQAEIAVRRNMHTALNYLLEREASMRESDFEQIRGFLGRINQNDQMIRIADAKGNRLLAVSNGVPEGWVAPAPPGPVPELVHVWREGHDLIVMRSPITIFDFQGMVEIVKSTDEFRQLSAAYSRVMFAFGAGAVVLFGLGGGFLAGQLLGPLQSMAETIRRIRRNGLQERVPVGRKDDEMVELMKLFNAMMDDVQRSFAQQRQFVEDASHELRTPIAIIQGHLALLQRWGKHDPAILEESLHAAMQESSRLKGLAEELLTLSRAERDDPATETVRSAPVARIVRETVDKASLIYPAFRIETALDEWSEAAVDIAPRHLEQIVLILLDNAVKYSGTSTLVAVKGGIADGRAHLDIRDFGIGIAERDLPYVTDRFYRADKARARVRGYGLGLVIAERLVSKYGGTIAIRSREGEGTTVRVGFPLSAGADRQNPRPRPTDA